MYPLASGAEQETVRRANHLEAMRVTVAFVEDELQTIMALHARQASSEAEVDHVRARLAKTRHDVALLENKSAEVARQCRVLVEIRWRQLERFQQLAGRGFGSELKMCMAKRRLVLARYLLNHVEGKPEAALSQLELTMDTASRQDVNSGSSGRRAWATILEQTAA
jgi:hypothetical protein